MSIKTCDRVREPHDEHGNCPGVPPDGDRNTTEQALGMLRALDDETALAYVAATQNAAGVASACLMGRHEDAVAELQRLRHLSGFVAAISDWVTGSYEPGLPEELVVRRRVDKVAEEAGEVITALGGLYGENPRKGVTNGPEEVIKELLDTAGASLGATYFLTGEDPIRLLTDHMEQVWRRAGLAGEETPDGDAQ